MDNNALMIRIFRMVPLIIIIQIHIPFNLQVFCPPNTIRINGDCLPLVGVGERCMYDLQCRTRPGDRPTYCGNFVCRYLGDGTQWEPTAEQRTFR
jgi:hypothetical protein